jgi:CRP-like cAMP-binding protein
VKKTSNPRATDHNRILDQLSQSDRDALLSGASGIRLPVGHAVARAGDALSSVYFPYSGVMSLVSEMTTGHQVAVGAVGPEGVVGLDSLFGAIQYPYRVMVLADSDAYQVSVDRFVRTFQQSEVLRRVMFLHIGQRVSELMITAACNRIHSHRQRLARWLLIATDRAGHGSLRVTHDTLAQLVGGPRHAVTVALKDLRNKGAITYLRGQLEITRRPLLIEQACECYRLQRRPSV